MDQRVNRSAGFCAAGLRLVGTGFSLFFGESGKIGRRFNVGDSSFSVGS